MPNVYLANIPDTINESLLNFFLHLGKSLINKEKYFSQFQIGIIYFICLQEKICRNYLKMILYSSSVFSNKVELKNFGFKNFYPFRQ